MDSRGQTLDAPRDYNLLLEGSTSYNFERQAHGLDLIKKRYKITKGVLNWRYREMSEMMQFILDVRKNTLFVFVSFLLLWKCFCPTQGCVHPALFCKWHLWTKDSTTVLTESHTALVLIMEVHTYRKSCFLFFFEVPMSMICFGKLTTEMLSGLLMGT